MMDPFYASDSEYNRLCKEMKENPVEATNILKALNGFDKVDCNKFSKEESVSNKLKVTRKKEKKEDTSKSVFVVLSGGKEQKIKKFLAIASSKKLAKNLFQLDNCKKIKKNIYLDNFGIYYKIKKVSVI